MIIVFYSSGALQQKQAINAAITPGRPKKHQQIHVINTAQSILLYFHQTPSGGRRIHKRTMIKTLISLSPIVNSLLL